MQSKSILMIVDHLGHGGAERITLQLAEYLTQQGHRVCLAVLNGRLNQLQIPPQIDYVDLALSEHFAYGKMWKTRRLSPAEQQRLDALQARVQPDLIVTGYNNGHWLGDALQGNVWHWIHGELIERRSTHHWLKALKEWLRRLRHRHAFVQLFTSKNLIVVNQDLATHYQALLPQSEIRVIANGVDIAKLHAQLPTPIPAKTWQVLFLGRLAPIKQPDHALRAFANSGLTGRMAIAGDGAQRAMLEQLAVELGVADRVDFLGWVSQPAPIIAASQTVVLSSLSEGSPMAVAEALALGTNVVAYNCCRGIADTFPPALHAQALVTPQHQTALAQQLYQVCMHPYRFAAEDQYKLSIDHMAAQFLALIRN